MADALADDDSYDGWVSKDSFGLIIDVTVDWESLDDFINVLLKERP